jgi:hypothetical protein
VWLGRLLLARCNRHTHAPTTHQQQKHKRSNHTRNAKPEMILCPTEFAVISAAHGYAKATGKPALAIKTLVRA